MYIRTNATAPSVPTNFRVSAGCSEANLSWGAPVNDGGGTVYNYTVYAGANSSALSPLLNVSDYYIYWKNGYTLNNLTNGQEYYFAVQAINPVGRSNLTDMIMVKPLPSPTLILTSEEVSWGHFNLTVTWEPPEPGYGEVVGYVLYVDGISAQTRAIEYPVGERNYSYSLSAFGNYIEFRVAAVYEDGNVSYSNMESISFGYYEGRCISYELILIPLAIIAVMVTLLLLWLRSSRRKKVE